MSVLVHILRRITNETSSSIGVITLEKHIVTGNIVQAYFIAVYPNLTENKNLLYFLFGIVQLKKSQRFFFNFLCLNE